MDFTILAISVMAFCVAGIITSKMYLRKKQAVYSEKIDVIDKKSIEELSKEFNALYLDMSDKYNDIACMSRRDMFIRIVKNQCQLVDAILAEKGKQ